MPMRVELMNEDGRTIHHIRDGGVLSTLIPEVIDERFTCWRFIDPFGETVFNHLQMPILRREIAMLRPAVNPKPRPPHAIDRDHILDLIEDLAATRTGTVHRYLRFVAE
jgi:hypothetical protein